MLLVYDGDCGFCVRSARWMERRLPAGARTEPWQSLNLENLGPSRPEAQAAVWWIEGDGPNTRRYRGRAAIGRALVAAGGAWGVVGRLIIRPPLCWPARRAYALIAANRHRMPGSR